MPSKSTVELDNVKLDDVISVAAEIGRGGTQDGRPGELCNAMTFVVTREVYNQSDGHAFSLYSNENGRRKLFDATLEYIDDHDGVISTYELSRAFISSYYLTSDDGNGRTHEVLTIHCGIVSMNSGSENATFTHEPYERKTKNQ